MYINLILHNLRIDRDWSRGWMGWLATHHAGVFWFHNFSLKLLPDSILRRQISFCSKHFYKHGPDPLARTFLARCVECTLQIMKCYTNTFWGVVCAVVLGLPLGCSPTLFILFPVRCSITPLTIVKEEK